MDGILEKDYVPQKIFDLQIEDIKYRTNTERERVDDRLEKNQAVIDRNMAEVKAMFAEIRGEIKRLDTKIDGVENSLGTAVAGVIDRLDDMKEYQNKWFTVFGILFTATAIIAPVAVAVVQHFMTK